MQAIFVGGASGVGASCVALEMDNQWIVIDAGVRVDRKSDPLPDLALLEGKDVRAIFVTHAHADHIGALPLVHQAFPTVPIFASRATGLLMEVMLADALRIMSRRAVEEMEIPLFPGALVESMLNRLRPLPIGEAMTLPMLPGITIHASRAGHIAGAVSLGFVSSEGSIVVSGDISSTPQRTVLGAVPPPLSPIDLLILESTYGARLHPNRQAEEQRLAQSVAEGLAEGGHVLIPCFGLGRGQEILLLLQAAQEKGQVPAFPIYVDGLVRRVCSTYQLMPEALTPTLQRQIRKGYLPFSGSTVSFVRDERERERILAGPPACIVSSSGMLTGGPSVWYAQRLAPNPKASILITGYQDEEAPGKKLLDLADHKKSMMELDGQQVQVECRVARYSLSAHADGGELAAYASALRPRQVALVHGDEDARAALRLLLSNTEVLLPENGTSIEPRTARSSQVARARPARPADAPAQEAIELPLLPTGIGEGAPLSEESVEQLWQAVIDIPTLRIITARELALVWYGEVTEEGVQEIVDILADDPEQPYFVRQYALEEIYRVRGQQEEISGDFLQDLPGNVVLLQINLANTKPALCRSLDRGARIGVQFPRSVSDPRPRFPCSAIFDLLGPLPEDIAQLAHRNAISDYLETLRRTARRIRRQLSAHDLAQQLQEEASYTLSDLCTLAGLSARSLEDRLAVAKLLHKRPLLFTQQRSVLDGDGQALYCLAPEWRDALEEPEERARPDQNWILGIIEKHIGSPPDLYRRSANPETGDVVLAFHFPAIAEDRYGEAIEAAAEEAGVSITLAPFPHQGELVKAVYTCLPEGLTAKGQPSVYHDQCLVQIACSGNVSQPALAEAQQRFLTATGWQLHIETTGPSAVQGDASTGVRHLADTVEGEAENTFDAVSGRTAPILQHLALAEAQRLLGSLPGFHRVGVNISAHMLLVRFYFPIVAQQRYANILSQLEAVTGWRVQVNPAVHQEALIRTAQRLTPAGLSAVGAPSIHLNQRKIVQRCTGYVPIEEIQEAQKQFKEETGWMLMFT